MLGLAVVSVAAGHARTPGKAGLRGVINPARAEQNWMLECQGCHRPDGDGSLQTAPAMVGFVSTFLSVPGGREYLARVPGVATAPLPDDQLAELLNWTLQRFDAGHLPQDFRPYTSSEMAEWRQRPLRIEAAALRRQLIEHINNGG